MLFASFGFLIMPDSIETDRLHLLFSPRGEFKIYLATRSFCLLRSFQLFESRWKRLPPASFFEPELVALDDGCSRGVTDFWVYASLRSILFKLQSLSADQRMRLRPP